MKKILLGCLLLCSAAIWAVPDQLLIKITNSGASDCVLKKSLILYGHVSDHTAIPQVIPPYQTESFMMRGTRFSDKSLLLTYACGADQEATFFTDGDTIYAHGHIVDAQNIQVTVKKFNLGKFTMRFSTDYPKIFWTLTY
ncbi:MAG: hypothetical protein NXI01_04570 [Gammaproteobacteria bacterium]|nr:hypothetical protein [Gammaproteobacteria bacterium]